MSLVLHRGGKEVDYQTLCAVETPDPTATHLPLPHHTLVDMMRYALPYYGHEIVAEHHALAEDGMRYFGLLSLRSTYGGYEDTVGLRNSHDKKFPIGIAFGSRVFVCDNCAFRAEHVIKRKHTSRARRELPGLLAEVVEPLQEQRKLQHQVFERYQGTPLTPQLADHAIMGMFREGVINVTRIPDVIEQWENPQFEWGEKTAWRMFNAATYTLTGKVAENPAVTRKLHEIIDGVCREVA